MRTTTTVMRWLINAILGIAVAAFVIFGLGPHTGQYRTLSILSGSMEPTFSTGDAIIATPVPARELREGDVISYHAPVDGRPLVTHRIIKILRHGTHPIVQTKGDASNAMDPWNAHLEPGTVWKQRASIPFAGHVTRALRHPVARTLTVYAFPLLLVCVLLPAIWRRPSTPGRHDAGEYWSDHEFDGPGWEAAWELHQHEETPLVELPEYVRTPRRTSAEYAA